jgi:hypothetical protein
MYNENKFTYIVVKMDNDDFVETLREDLEKWCPHLYPATKNGAVVVYKGLIPIKEARDLNTLLAVSPYGIGYEVTMDGLNIHDHRNNRRLVPFG